MQTTTSRTTVRNVLINSVLASISASIFVTIIHEFGHLIVSVSFGNSATLYHNRIETHNDELAFIQQLLIPMGGPVISFLQGLICLIFYKRIKNGITSLFVLWLGISGLMAFFGYMMIAPVAQVGDTGRIFQLLEISMIWQIIIAILSILIFTVMLLYFHKDFERFIPEDIQEDKLKRAKWARILILYPVLIGIVISTVLQFPIVVFLSILPSITMPFMLFMVYGRMIMSKNEIFKAKNKDVTYVSIPMIAFFIAAIIIFRLLVFGITF